MTFDELISKLNLLKRSGISEQPFETEEQAIERLKQANLSKKFKGEIADFMQYKPIRHEDLEVGDMARLGLDASPFVGDMIAMEDAKKAYQADKPGWAAFHALTALPIVGDLATAAKVTAPAAASLFALGKMMNRGTDSLSSAGKIGKQRGILGGIKARTANLEELHKAKRMTKAGVSRENIWKETGWFKAPDGKWRFEIDDSGATLNDLPSTARKYMRDQGVSEYPLSYSDVVFHPTLELNYPDVRDIRVTAKNYTKQGAYFQPQPHTQGVERMELGFKHNAGGLVDPGDARETTLHELQHAIQHREGFARGGSSSQFSDIKYQNLDFMDIDPGEQKLISDIMKKYDIPGDTDTSTIGEFIDVELLGKHKFTSPESKALRNIKNKYSMPYKSAFDQYRALAGEAEARAVQARMNLTPAERAARPFWMDYDVPEADQIVRFRGNIEELFK